MKRFSVNVKTITSGMINKPKFGQAVPDFSCRKQKPIQTFAMVLSELWWKTPWIPSNWNFYKCLQKYHAQKMLMIQETWERKKTQIVILDTKSSACSARMQRAKKLWLHCGCCWSQFPSGNAHDPRSLGAELLFNSSFTHSHWEELKA